MATQGTIKLQDFGTFCAYNCILTSLLVEVFNPLIPIDGRPLFPPKYFPGALQRFLNGEPGKQSDKR